MHISDFKITPGSVTSPRGYRACGIRCGLKTQHKDVALVASDVPAAVAGLFTSNRLAAAPVLVSREIVATGRAQALIVNSGNANACTGARGLADAREMGQLAARELNLAPELVLVASTGVIGRHLPMELIRQGVQQVRQCLSDQGGVEAAQAIMTTDTVPKHFATEFRLDDAVGRIGVIAKGAGMIQPNVATMICVFTTDVNIEPSLLQEALKEAVAVSLNALTIDGEMSTNDSVYLFANGRAGNAKITTKNVYYQTFATALTTLAIAVTRALAIDGEGATRLVTVTVTDAASPAEAQRAAKAVANSLLVKTAIFGRDPNWGRVISAVGASGVALNPEAIAIHFAGIRVADNGAAVAFDLPAMKLALEQREIPITISLGVGEHSATVYSCDLSYDYVRINAEYHT